MSIRGDLESGGEGNRTLYPNVLEDPKLLWAFIREVYFILTIQLLLTIAVASVVFFVRTSARFFFGSILGFVLAIVLLFVPIIPILPLRYYHKKYPVNYLLLFFFTITLGFAVGLVCAFISGKAILIWMISTTVVVFSLTLYTFWALRRGHDFRFLGPFLFSALLVLLAFALIRILFPLGAWSSLIYGSLSWNQLCFVALLYMI